MSFTSTVIKDLVPQPLSELLPQIQNGDILLCDVTHPFARLIKWSTQSPWSHIAIVFFSTEFKRFIVFECVTKGGVRAVPLERFVQQGSNGKKPFPGKIILARHEDTQKLLIDQASEKFAIDRLGDVFSDKEIFKIGLRILFGRLNRPSPKSFTVNTKFICSEYVAACFEEMNITIKWDGRGFIAPVDFAQDPKVQAIAQIKTM